MLRITVPCTQHERTRYQQSHAALDVRPGCGALNGQCSGSVQAHLNPGDPSKDKHVQNAEQLQVAPGILPPVDCGGGATAQWPAMATVGVQCQAQCQSRPASSKWHAVHRRQADGPCQHPQQAHSTGIAACPSWWPGPAARAAPAPVGDSAAAWTRGQSNAETMSPCQASTENAQTSRQALGGSHCSIDHRHRCSCCLDDCAQAAAAPAAASVA